MRLVAKSKRCQGGFHHPKEAAVIPELIHRNSDFVLGVAETEHISEEAAPRLQIAQLNVVESRSLRSLCKKQKYEER